MQQNHIYILIAISVTVAIVAYIVYRNNKVDDEYGGIENGTQLTSQAQVEQLVKSGKPIVVAFISQGCGWCTKLKQEAMSRLRGVKTRAPIVMIEANNAGMFGFRRSISGFPTIIKVVPGKTLEDYKGDRSVEDLVRFANA